MDKKNKGARRKGLLKEKKEREKRRTTGVLLDSGALGQPGVSGGGGGGETDALGGVGDSGGHFE